MRHKSKALFVTLAASMLTAIVASNDALGGSRVVDITIAPAPKADGAVLEIPQACDPRAESCSEPEIEWAVESVTYFDDSKPDHDKKADKSKTEEAKSEPETRVDDSDRASQTIDEYQPVAVAVATAGAMGQARGRGQSPQPTDGPGPASAYLPSIVPPPARAPTAGPAVPPTFPTRLPPGVAPFLAR
ncbi:MAG: hypothetical protein ACREQF_03980 [Candidatus Binataceae bacterium]